MQTPLVSVVVPTFNRAHLIGRTIESALAQTYGRVEVTASARSSRR
jgi:glycosyltransferase involved in cell wall biosynthesis